MEATKLHNVIYDGIEEETALKLTAKINLLITQIQQNQAPQIDKTFKELEKLLIESVFNSYSPSNFKILEEIKGSIFFGEKALNRIKEILESNAYNTSKIIADLQLYVKERNEFMTTIIQLKANFDKLEILPHFSTDEYELGLLLPSNDNYDNVKVLTKELNKWDKTIKAYRELVGEGVEDTKVTLVNNGSLEFFTENPEQVALCISFTLERLFKLYKNILEIREAWNKLKNTGLPKSQEKGIIKHEKDIYTKEIDSIVADVIKKFADKKIDDGRLNELKVSIKGHTSYMAKCIDNGLVIEITPPEISEPSILKEAETEENKKERTKAKSDFNSKLKQADNVKKGLQAGKEIFGLGKEIFKMITNGETDDSSDENNEE